MDLDGVEADVIYTTLGFRQFWFTDAALQRACFRVYYTTGWPSTVLTRRRDWPASP